MSTASTQAEWYYVGHYGQLGPLTFEQMEELIRDGVIARDTYVWRTGMHDWVQASVVPELRSAVGFSAPQLDPARVPPPPPNPLQPASIVPGLGAMSVSYSPTSLDWAGTGGTFIRSDKSRIAAGLLNFIPGVGRLYLGYAAHGVLQIMLAFMCGIGWIWSIIDGIVILSGGVRFDGYGRRLDD